MRDERRKQAFANISNSFLLFYQHKVSSQALFLPLLFQFHLGDEDKLHVFIPIKVSEIKPQSKLVFKSKPSSIMKEFFHLEIEGDKRTKHEACSSVKLQRVKTFFPLSLAIEALFSLC